MHDFVIIKFFSFNLYLMLELAVTLVTIQRMCQRRIVAQECTVRLQSRDK